MEAKNEALELARELSGAAVDGTMHSTMGHDAAAMLRSQVAEIEQWQVDFAEVLRECDQLKAKNEKLVELLDEAKNYTSSPAWSPSMTEEVVQALKENTWQQNVKQKCQKSNYHHCQSLKTGT